MGRAVADCSEVLGRTLRFRVGRRVEPSVGKSGGMLMVNSQRRINVENIATIVDVPDNRLFCYRVQQRRRRRMISLLIYRYKQDITKYIASMLRRGPTRGAYAMSQEGKLHECRVDFV